MLFTSRTCLALLVFSACVLALPAQTLPVADAPQLFTPLRAQSKQDLDHREALKLYGLAMLRQREDLLLEAVHLLEDACHLDPNAAPLHRSLIPLYFALCRNDDALSSCRKVLDIQPNDFETRYLYARQLKEQGKTADSLKELAKAVAAPRLKDRPEILVQIYFDLGVLYEDAKDFDRAIAAFKEVVKVLDKPETLLEIGPFQPELLNAEAAKTYERMGKVCAAAQRYDQAVAAFRKAQAKAPDQAGRLNYNLADACLARGKKEEALNYLNEYLRIQPQGDEAYKLKITIMKQLGRKADIVRRELESHAAVDKYNVPLKLLLAAQYAEAGDSKEAITRYLQLAEVAPNQAVEVYRGLFKVYQTRGQVGEALKMLDTALKDAAPKEKPKDQGGDNSEESSSERDARAVSAAKARAMVAVLKDDASLVKSLLQVVRPHLRSGTKLTRETTYFLAVLAARTHQTDDAENLYQDCLNSDVRLQPELEASVYGGLLRVLWVGRKYDRVVEVCRRGLRQAQATNRILFHTDLAKALSVLGKNDEALAAADEAVKNADDDSRLYCRDLRVRLLGQAGQFDRAVSEGMALLKEFTQPKEVREIRYTLSNVYSTAKDFPKSEEQLQKILKDDPNDATANNDLGYIMADQGKNLDEAERMIRKAIDLDREQKKASTSPDDEKENAAYLDSLGWVLFRRGRFEEARTWMEKAAALLEGAEDPVVWDHLGDVYFRLHETARARTVWEKAVDLYKSEKRRKPDDRLQEIRHKLKLLEMESK